MFPLNESFTYPGFHLSTVWKFFFLVLVMQVRVIVVEELLEKKNSEIIFPEYSKDSRLIKWSSGVEKVSLPSSLVIEKFGKSHILMQKSTKC